MSTLETNLIQPSTGTTLTVGASGDTVTAPSGVTVAGAMSNTPAFSANRISSAPTGSVNTFFKATFDNELYDTNNAYDTSNSRFTVPSGQAGKYHFETAFQSYELTANNNISKWYVAFYKNGSNELFVTTGGGNLVGNERTNVLSATLNLSVGDYIEVYLRVNTSGTVAFEAGNEYNRFSGHRLIGV
jgi:hypothetical protein